MAANTTEKTKQKNEKRNKSACMKLYKIVQNVFPS